MWEPSNACGGRLERRDSRLQRGNLAPVRRARLTKSVNLTTNLAAGEAGNLGLEERAKIRHPEAIAEVGSRAYSLTLVQRPTSTGSRPNDGRAPRRRRQSLAGSPQ